MCMICVCLQVYLSAGGLQTHCCFCCMVQLGKGKVLAGVRTTAVYNEYVPAVNMHERVRSACDPDISEALCRNPAPK